MTALEPREYRIGGSLARDGCADARSIEPQGSLSAGLTAAVGWTREQSI
jgi:hypothetical protein